MSNNTYDKLVKSTKAKDHCYHGDEKEGQKKKDAEDDAKKDAEDDAKKDAEDELYAIYGGD